MINNIKKYTTESGQTLIEILVVVALLAIFLPALAVGLTASTGGKAQESERLQAVAVLREGSEAIRSVRERGWSELANLNTALDYHPAVVGSAWNIVAGIETGIDGAFSRKINIADVYRDPSGNITTSTVSPNVLDQSTKKITVTVSWVSPFASSVSSTSYLTRYLNPASSIQTTQADFTAGSQSSTQVTNTSGGEVVLAQSGNGDWCQPDNFLLNPPLVLPTNTTAVIVKASPGGNAFIGFSPNGTTNTIIFAYVKITSFNNPIQATVQGVFYGNYTVSDISGDGHYAYLATSSSGQEGQILDLTAPIPGSPYPTYPKVGWFTSGNSGVGRFVFTDNNTAFLVSSLPTSAFGAAVTSFDITSKIGSRTRLSPLPTNGNPMTQLRGIPHAAYYAGGYMFIGNQTDTTDHGQIFDLRNPALTYTKYNAYPNAGADINQLYVDSNGYLYTLLGFSPLSGQTFKIFNTANKSTWTTYATSQYKIPCGTTCAVPAGVTQVPSLSTTNAGMNTAAFSVADDRIVVVGNVYGSATTGSYRVFNATNKAAPSLCGTMTGTLSAMRSVTTVTEPSGAYAYLLTADSGNSFKIVKGGGGGSSYVSTGTFTSSPLTFANSTAFNKIQFTFDQPTGTSIKFKVASANQVSGSCVHNQYTFLGPDGTTGTFFQTASTGTNLTLTGTIPFLTSGNYFNPGRCFKYQVTLTPNATFTTTPILKDFTLSYTP